MLKGSVEPPEYANFVFVLDCVSKLAKAIYVIYLLQHYYSQNFLIFYLEVAYWTT